MNALRRLLTPTREAFGRKFVKALHRAGIKEATYEADANRIVIPGKSVQLIFLSNYYAEYTMIPLTKRPAVLDAFVRNWISNPPPPDSFAEARRLLLPRARDRAFHCELALRKRADDAFQLHEIPFQLLSEEIAVELVLDFPNTIQPVPATQLAEWNVTFNEAMTVARENLWKISNDPFLQVGDGLHVALWQDNHAASSIVLHDLIWQLPVKGDHVAMVPHRDRLLVTGSQDDAGLIAIAKLTESLLEDNRFELGIPAVLRGSQWSTFQPTRDRECWRDLHNLAALTRSRQYATQGALLEAIQQKSGDAFHIGPCDLQKNTTSGVVSTYAFWANGVPLLIPKTELLGVGNAAVLPWDAAWQAAPELFEPMNHWPERYRVGKFPNQDQLTRMQEAARSAATHLKSAESL